MNYDARNHELKNPVIVEHCVIPRVLPQNRRRAINWSLY